MLDLFAFKMGLHGWIALVIAVIGIVALHLGLMYLATRRGRGPDDAPPPDDPPTDPESRR